MVNPLLARFGPTLNANVPSQEDIGQIFQQPQQSPLQKLIGNPLLLNLLAQSGYAETPDSPLGALGRAGLMTQQQQQQTSMQDLQKELLRSRIGLTNAQAQRESALAELPGGGLNPSKPPASIAEYNLYVEQTTAAGAQPMPFNEWIKEREALAAGGRASGSFGVSTPAQTAADQAFAQEYVNWTRNEQADALKGLQQLKSARDSLTSGENVSGPGVGMTQATLGDRGLALFNPKASNTKQLIEEVVQRNLRLILGAQFAEKEGERLIARAYDPNLEEQFNIDRLNRLIAQMELAISAKQSQVDYYNRFGTLRGWQGKSYSMKDFEDAIKDSGGSSDKPISEMTDEELEAIANGSNP